MAKRKPELVPVYVIDPENRIVRTNRIDSSFDGVCAQIGCEHLMGMPFSGSTLFVNKSGKYVDGGVYFARNGHNEILSGLGVVAKIRDSIDSYKIQHTDLKLNDIRKGIQFFIASHREHGEMDTEDVPQRTGIA